jgi:hypothetical protein
MILRKLASLKESEMKKKDVGTYQSSEYRPTINPKVVEALKPFAFEDAIATLHQVVGPLRPDEFQAVMKKDASLIRPGIIPYVGYQQVSGNFEGTISRELVAPLQKVAGLELSQDCKVVQADFLSPEERYAYLHYRKSYGLQERSYLR